MNNRFRFLVSMMGVFLLYQVLNRRRYETETSNKSLLWEVTGNGLKEPSYLYGTMHLLCEEDAALSKNVKQIIKSVKQVYLEMDISDHAEIMDHIDEMTTSTKQLSDVLSEEEYNKVRDFFEASSLNIPFYILERQFPIMIMSSLYELFLTCEHKNGVELKIIHEAKDNNTPIKGLETFAFQSSILQTIPYEQQAKELLHAIENIDHYKEELDQMVKYYQLQDIDMLYKISTKEDSLANTHSDVLLYNRNEVWCDQFKTIAANGSTLLAVGAGHLGGEHGMVSILKNRGYFLRALKNN